MEDHSRVADGVIRICHQLLALFLFGEVLVDWQVHVGSLAEVLHDFGVDRVVHLPVLFNVAEKVAEGSSVVFAETVFEFHDVILVDRFEEHIF